MKTHRPVEIGYSSLSRGYAREESNPACIGGSQDCTHAKHKFPGGSGIPCTAEIEQQNAIRKPAVSL
jgi:hypothetical protein